MGELLQFPIRKAEPGVLGCRCAVQAGRFEPQASCPVHGGDVPISSSFPVQITTATVPITCDAPDAA